MFYTRYSEFKYKCRAGLQILKYFAKAKQRITNVHKYLCTIKISWKYIDYN